ncbi:hypothetical protein BCR33DRAFT_721707, partial [Rhizoclosmatium globosum]
MRRRDETKKHSLLLIFWMHYQKVVIESMMKTLISNELKDCLILPSLYAQFRFKLKRWRRAFPTKRSGQSMIFRIRL